MYDNLHGLAPQRLAAVSAQERARDFDTALATYAGRLLIFEDGGLVEAVDVDTGVVKWHTMLPSSSPLVATPFIDALPIVAGGVVAVQACTAPPDRTRVFTLEAASGNVMGPGVVVASGCESSALVAASATAVTVVGGGSVSDGRRIAEGSEVRSFDPRTGAEKWTQSWSGGASLDPPIASAVIGDVLYFTRREGGQTTIGRIDLRAGLALAPLALDPRLSPNGIISGRAEELGVLLYTGVNTIARLDPGSGRAIWVAHPTTDDPGGSGDVIRVDQGSDSAWYYTPAGDGSFQLQVLDLESGRLILTAPGDRPLDWEAASNADSDSGLYGGLLVTHAALTKIPAGPRPHGLDRLEALDPRTLRPVWLGPWSSDSLQILPGPAGAPHLVIALSCAPNGIDRTGGTCATARLYAVNSAS